MARKPFQPNSERKVGPRANEEINAPKIRLIGANGENLGLLSPNEGLDMASRVGLDLVEISATSDPPVCKIMDYGKYKYTQQKKESLARKKQKIIEVKEVKFRPNTGIHDYNVKLRNVLRFLENGDQVKVTLRFRGREMAHQSLGKDLLDRVKEDVGEMGKLVATPKYEGRQIFMVLGPTK
ncbi:MAG: translation initiation factor IF-3 [Rhodobacteraceae bacterium]|nr:translation initiation factor IF-3 [Paracoccaceae bacterium]MYF46709.1 translation initiation factor IF-3 [Paracoccaceae bacterium]MYI90507.1 translation initiation factor IF-3 [Paracoccaceae bacterium]